MDDMITVSRMGGINQTMWAA